MKAAKFQYLRPDSLEAALAALSKHHGDARVIAGGQSLVPMMAMRLAQPEWLIDISRIPALGGIDVRDTYVETGALMRQRELEDLTGLGDWLPLLPRAVRWVGHRQTRNRGTVGGSLVQADPSAELVLCARLLNARICLVSQAGGERWLDADAFFTGAMTTAIEDSECLVKIRWPRWVGRSVGAAFEEVAIRQGDFALASAACQAAIDENGNIERIVFGVGGVDAVPLAFESLADKLTRRQPDPTAIAQVAVEASAMADPSSDVHASADYRRHLAATLLQRVITRAVGLPPIEHERQP